MKYWKRRCARSSNRCGVDARLLVATHSYIYVLDPEWGPAFIRICGYAPFPIKIGLNGHEWAKRQLEARRIRFTALDNGFLTCARPDALQRMCDALDATAINRFFARWQLIPSR
jgi:hypothetical protein